MQMNMKLRVYSLSVLFLIPSLLCGMEKKIVIGPEINDIEYPMGLHYLDNEHLIIYDQYKFNIVNIRKKTTTLIPSRDKNLLGLKGVVPIVHNDNKKILTLHNSGTQKFNIDTGEYDLPIKTDALKHVLMYGYVHHPLSNSVFFSLAFYPHAIRRYNYITNQTTTSSFFDRETCVMTVHPKKEVVCTADYQGNMLFYHFDDLSKPFQKIKLPIQADGAYFCEYTPQGDNIAVVVGEKFFNIDPNEKKFTYSPVQKEGDGKIYSAPVRFHPNGILAMVCNLSQKRNSEYEARYKICYWDIIQDKLIHTTAQKEGPIIKYLTFAPCGQECAVFLANNTCEIMPVPFEVIYQCTPQKMCYFLSVLNRVQKEQNLPQEIKKYISYMVLATLKR